MKKVTCIICIHFKIYLLISCCFIFTNLSFALSQEVKLDKGFQLVSHSFEEVNLPDQSFGSNLIIIWTFDSSSEKYLFYTNDLSTKSKLISLSFQEFTKLNKNTSYYFFSDKNTNIRLTGTSLSTPIQSIQFTKANELRYLSSPLGFLVNDLGTSYHSIWVMKNKFWSVYSPDPLIQSQYTTLPKLQEVQSNQSFIIISKNASLIQFPQYKFPQHYGLQQGLKVTAQESYGHSFSTTSPRVKIVDPSQLSSAQDSLIEWLISKKLQHLLIDPIPTLNNHYLNFTELSTIGLSPPNDPDSLCQFITKLNSKGITTGLDLSKLTQLNSDNFKSTSEASHLSSKLSTNSYLSIIKSFESSSCLVKYIYSQSLESNLQSDIQTQTQINLFSPESEIFKTEQISSLKNSSAYSSKSTYPIVILNGSDLTKSSKEALVYSRYKLNPIFLHSSTSTLSLTKDFTQFDNFNFAFIQDLNSKYQTKKSTKIANIVLLGQTDANQKQEKNLSNVSSILHSMGYDITISNQNYVMADLYYFIHYSDHSIGDLAPLLALDKPKFWQENSSPMVISTNVLTHFQMTKSTFDLLASPSTLDYQSKSFTLTRASSSSFVIKPADISSSATTIIASNDGGSYLFLKDNLYFVNADFIGLEFNYPLRAILNSDGIETVNQHHYTVTEPPIILANASEEINLKLSQPYKSLTILKNFDAMTDALVTSQTLNVIDQNLYIFSKNHTPVSTIQSDYIFNGSQKITIPSTTTDLDLDPLTFLWAQTSGATLTIDEPKSQTLRLQLPSRSESIQKFTFSLQSFDGKDYSSPVSTQVQILANNAPLIDLAPSQSFTGSSAITISPEVIDPNSDLLTYQWSQISGPTVTLQDVKSKNLSFITPAKTTSLQTLIFQISVSDSWITSQKQIEILVLANKAPNVFVQKSNNPDFDDNRLGGFPYTFQSSASDPDGDTLSYTWRVISPENLDITIHNGLHQSQLAITTPSVNSTTDIVVGIKAFDGLSFSMEKKLTLRVEVCQFEILEQCNSN